MDSFGGLIGNMPLRIFSIIFPLFAVALAGWLYGRARRPDISVVNQINMDVFVPALVFATLAGKSFDFASYRLLAMGGLIVILGSGLLAWPLARWIGIADKTFVPPMMFNNAGNMGLPLAVLAFGEESLPAAVVLFVVATLLHFSLGAWILDRHTRLSNLWRVPVVFASLAGLGVSVAGAELWPALMIGIKMLGEISIPLLLFSLGVRLTDASLMTWRVGIAGAVARPVLGMLIAWLSARLLGLDDRFSAMLLVFGALPPAVLNYVFAERYRQEAEKVASIVMIGNIAALFFVSVALALVLD